LSEDAYNGDAQFSATMDNTQLTNNSTVTASHAANQSQSFNYNGSWGSSGQHTITVTFLNDAWGGSTALDRNLWAPAPSSACRTSAPTSAGSSASAASAFDQILNRAERAGL
jgi:hypothetical protein